MKSIIFLTFLLISFTLFSQSWAVPGSNWKYNHSNGFGTDGYAEINYEKDTIIEGQPCQKLVKYHHVYDYLESRYEHYSLGNEYTYDDSGVVHVWYKDNWDTLFNFNAEVGESWGMAKETVTHVCDTNSYISVLSKGTKVINGISLRYSVVEFVFNASGSNYHNHTDTMIERIGFKDAYLFPYEMCDGALDIFEGGPLRCYTDDEIGTYKTRTYPAECNYIAGIEEMKFKQRVISLIPNPASNQIQLNGNLDITQTKMEILNLTGQKQLVKQLDNTIDISHLANGVYILSVIYKDGKQNLRFVKQ